MFRVSFSEVDPVTVYTLEYNGQRVRGKLSHKYYPGLAIFVFKDDAAKAGVEPGAVLDVRHEHKGIIGQVEYQH